MDQINHDLDANKYSDEDLWAFYDGVTNWVPLYAVPGVGDSKKRQLQSSPGQVGQCSDPVATSTALSDSKEAKELFEYLRGGGPAEVVTVTSRKCFENRCRFYELVVADNASPRLTYFILKANHDAAKYPYLVVEIGERTQFDLAWNHRYEPHRDQVLRERSLPEGRWDDIAGEGCAAYANHSKPGCSLASQAGFNGLVSQILQGQYRVEQVFRSSHPAQVKAQRWDALITGKPTVRADVACQICGDNLVSPGWNGSHLRCANCGTIYCRRNCMASIHGQCPRCGEADRINAVE